ncbi:hypothetical protein ES705_16470 [subsurface metagenome]
MTIGDDITISGGTFYARVSTITLSGSNTDGSADWDSYGGLFTYGTSTVDLKETGTVTVTSSWSGPFYNLTCAYPNKTTTLTASMGIKGILSVKGGTLTTTGTPVVYLHKTPSPPPPISIVNDSTISVYRLEFAYIQTVPGYNYGSIITVWNTGTITQDGDVTCKGLRVDGDGFGERSPTWNTDDHTLTVNGNLLVGNFSGSTTGTHTFNASGSTITVSGTVQLNHPNAYLNLDTSNMRVAGNWTIKEGNVIPSTSTVTFYGTGTSTSTLTGSTTFYVLVSTTTGKTVKFSSNTITGVTGHLNFENITLGSNINGTTWYLNLQGTQDVHHVDVRDSNADDGNTIYAGCSTDSGNNTNWIFDDSILTWDGSESTDWNTAANWNFNIVPLSTHTVIIPDGTPYDPQLTSNVIISSITIETDGQLSLNEKNITVTSDVYLHGSLICAAGEQITVGGNWDSSAGTFNYNTSTVDLTGTGNLKTPTTGGAYAPRFYNLKVATTTKETTLLSHVAVADTLTIGDGTVTGPSFYFSLIKNSETPLNLGNATITLNRIVYRPSNGTVTVTGGNYGTLNLLLFPTASGATFDLGGSVTVTGMFWLLAPPGINNVVCDTQDNGITATRLCFGGGSSNDGSTTLNCGTSTIDIGTTGLDVTNNGGSHTLNLSSATVTCAGIWRLSYGSGSIAQIPGTSTVTLDDTSGTQTVTSNNQSFYHLVIDNTGTSVQLQDAADIDGGLNVATGTLDLNSYDITISSDVYIDGVLTCSAGEQITVGGNWDSSAGTFNYNTSTVDLTGTGNLKTPGGWNGTYFYNLKVAAANETTTMLSHVGVADTLTLGNATGTLTDGAFSFNVTLKKNSGAPLSHGGATIAISRIIYRPSNGTVTVTGEDYEISYLELYPSDSGATFNLGGNVTVPTGTFWLHAPNGTSNVVCNTQNYSLTASRLWFGYSTTYGTTTLNCGTSTIDIGTSGVVVVTDGGSHILNLSSATVTCEGNWQLSAGTGTITQIPGTSTVTFDGTGTSTLTGSTTFYVLISTTTGKNLKFTSDIVIGVTNHLNFENITLRSTSSGATWYLNLSGDQDVSGVDVRDSNASGGDTIIDFDCPYIESCYYGNNTNWDFGPPAAITDLTGECDSDTGYVTLYWSTPGDDEWTGVLSSTSEYRIDYSTDSSRQWDKDTYEVSIPTHSVAPNTEVSRIITGLTGDTTWYFRIWTADEIPLWSGLSNGCTVWVNPILSVSISTDTYSFGKVPLGVSTHTVSIITVTNDGNIAEDFGLSCITTTPGGSPWYPGLVGESSDYYNRFILRGVFNETEVATDDFGPEDTIEEDIRWSQSTSTFTVTGSYTGAGVEADGDRNIWFRLDLPTTSGTSKDQQITVTITAKEPD